MSYSKTNWENLPSTNTPINATNLNKIETELKTLDEGVDISSHITLNESGSISLKQYGNIVYISFFGENKARTSGQLIGTLASGYRPTSNTRAVFVTSNGSAIGNILVSGSTGQVTIEGISANATGRIFFQMFYWI